MKMKFFLMLGILISVNLCKAQHNRQADTLKNRFKLLFIINFHDRPPLITAYNFTDPEQREYIHFLHGEQYDEIKKYLKADLIAIVQLKHGVRTLTLTDVFNKYHIAEKYRHCKILYDDEVIDFPETMLMSSNEITNVKILKSANGSFTVDIIGVDYPLIKKMKEDQKKGVIFDN